MKQNPYENKEYLQRVAELQPKRNLAAGMAKAFWTGGLICAMGQGLSFWAQRGMGWDEAMSGTFVAIVLIFLGAVLTGLGWYDCLGTYAGAGSVVPITGFANAMVASAMEYRKEGGVTGVGGKLLTIAGPVLVYGTLAAMLAGVFDWIVRLLQ